MMMMKQIKFRYFVLTTLLLICSFLQAQNREIAFEHSTLQEVLAEARKADKPVFVDCYTEYCGPCRLMASTVFKTDSVADFFNKTFINLKLDMLSEDGKKYGDVYKVGAYPTFLILDNTGKEIYKFVGSQSTTKFMALIRSGMNPNNQMLVMDKTYASGKYTDSFVQSYIKLKLGLFEKNEAKAIAKKYLDKLPVERYTLPENWFLFTNRYLAGVQSYDSHFLIEHWADFLKPIGSQKVYDRIGEIYREITESVMRKWYFKDFKPNPTDFDYYSQHIASISIPYQQDYLDMMDACKAACRKDSAEVQRIFLDKAAGFSDANKEALFGVLSSYFNFRSKEFHDLAVKIVRTGSKSNIVKYFKTYLKPGEAYSGEKYDVPNLKDKIGSMSIAPHFGPTSDTFWYAFNNADEASHYYGYDIQHGKYELYDSRKIESQLKNGLSKDIIFYDPEFDNGQLVAKVNFKNKYYIYDNRTGKLQPSEVTKNTVRAFGVSPDLKYKVTSKDYNLWQEDMTTHKLTQLTTDGVKDADYVVADMEWLSDNKYYIVRHDSRNVRTFNVLYSASFNGPTVANYKYELPGDTIIATQQLYIGDVAKGTITKVNTDRWRWQQLQVLHVKDVTDKVYFLRLKRTCDVAELCTVDAATGQVKSILTETSKPYINDILMQFKVANKGNDIFVWSDRSGWGHIYHYSATGKLLNAVTSGNWTAGRILKIDDAKKVLYLEGYGREKNINPNYTLAYKVGFNGKRIQLLTPENASHHVFISPTGNLLVDNFSRIDTVPQVAVRSTDGKLLQILERTDVSKLLEYGWKYPEQFTVKAADGVTDLYGIMWKPYDFDPSKKYPVVSQVYPGPFTETVWTEFTVFDKYNNTALAQRGIIVVCMGHRGGSPYRNKKYAQFGYGNLRDYPLADDICGLKQLVQKYPFIDINRVGIYGHSGGAAMAVAAICTYPDFYKVCVASSGNYDNRIYNRHWGETYQGIGEDNKFTVKTDTELIKNLKGKLLLVTGESDQNVHPAHTMRLVDELIRQNKDFDMMILPSQSHHYEEPYNSYFEKMKRDYFSKYLLEK
jgi:dipeptidyl aminopeptidase/acylaminoacyl peptidase/thiol-disulfide isomerase/thioredoxin